MKCKTVMKLFYSFYLFYPCSDRKGSVRSFLKINFFEEGKGPILILFDSTHFGMWIDWCWKIFFFEFLGRVLWSDKRLWEKFFFLIGIPDLLKKDIRKQPSLWKNPKVWYLTKKEFKELRAKVILIFTDFTTLSGKV